MKKLRLVACALILICLFAVSGCGFNHRDSIENRWNIDLPVEMRELYHADSWGWFGDGCAYTLFKAENLTTYDFKNNCENNFGSRKYSGWNDKSDTKYCDAVINFVNNILLDNLKISEDNTPDFNDDYICSQTVYKDDEILITDLHLVVMWFPTENHLAVFERRT